MNRPLVRRLPAALLASGVLLFTAAAANGAGETITLTLQGGVDQGNKTACKQVNHYQAYKLGTRISMDGTVDPRPAFPDGTWKVKIKIKKCVRGRFVVVGQSHVLGNSTLVNGVKTAVFSKTIKPKLTGFYFARAYYYGYTPYIQSTDEHFHITR